MGTGIAHFNIIYIFTLSSYEKVCCYHNKFDLGDMIIWDILFPRKRIVVEIFGTCSVDAISYLVTTEFTQYNIYYKQTESGAAVLVVNQLCCIHRVE